MKVAMIGPTYTPGVTYQENMWCEHLARMGHQVRMFWAGHETEPIKTISGQFGSFEESRLKTRFLPRSTFSSKEIAPAVRAFRPDLIVVAGDKLFAAPVATDKSLKGVPLIATFSENLGMHEFDWRKPGITIKQRIWAVGFRALRAGPIKTISRRATMLVGNTPQGRQIVLPLFSSRERAEIASKFIDMPLGFSPEHFSYGPEVRKRVRGELNVAADEILVCVSSHFDAIKAVFVNMIIDALNEVMGSDDKVRGLIVGFSDKSGAAEHSRAIEQHIQASPFAARFIRQPFANRTMLAELYNASDIAAFGRPSISCQEALGTGLVGCFADDGAVNHLVRDPDQGVFFKPGDRADLARMLATAARAIGQSHAEGRDAFRARLADAARWLGYDRIIAATMQELERRLQ